MSDTLWDIDMSRIKPFLDTLSRAQVTAIDNVVDMLRDRGPGLKRPTVGEVHESWITNLKEMRPAAVQGQVVRILFVFDPQRRGIALYGGIKGTHKGSNRDPWKKWYKPAIAIAEERYAEHLETIKKG